MHFPVSGVECSPLLPPLVAFVVASLTASAGVSGAFLLLPFQMSVLGFTSPAVSATNLLYNVVAIPGGVFRYLIEKRMAWPVVWVTSLGTLPGIFLGAVIRVRYLPDPASIKLFVGAMLLYLGWRLFKGSANRGNLHPLPKDATVRTRSVSWLRIEYDFRGETCAFRPVPLLFLSLAVGLAGGIYGIGGGAIIAPFLVGWMRLPVHSIAGATLFGTFLTSLAGVFCFELLAYAGAGAGTAVGPDWALGLLFGAGGLAGTYAGARMQRYLPERWIRIFLGLLVTGLGAAYVVQFPFVKSIK